MKSRAIEWRETIWISSNIPNKVDLNPSFLGTQHISVSWKMEKILLTKDARGDIMMEGGKNCLINWGEWLYKL